MSDRTRVAGHLVRALWRRVVLLWGLAGGFALAASVGAALALAVWFSGTEAWVRPSVVPLLIWVVPGLALGLGFVTLTRRLRAWSARAAAAEIELRQQWPRGTVEGAVEPGVQRPGISEALIARQRDWLADQLAGRRLGELGSRTVRGATRAALLATTAAVVGVSAAVLLWESDPGAARAAWADLADPVRHLSSPPLPPLALRADSLSVRRGHDLSVFVGAPARDSVLLRWQARGEPVGDRWLPVASGRAEGRVLRIEAPTRVWAWAPDGATSDTLEIAPVDPLMLLELTVALDYPGHTGRGDETYRSPLPPLAVPVGTRATVTGKTTLPLARAALRSGAETEPEEIILDATDERRFRGTFPVRDGVWGWNLEGEGGQPLEGSPDSLRFATVPDSVPTVRILYPGADTTLPVEMTQRIVVEARDDYGISRVELVSWRVSERGERWPEQVEEIPLEGLTSRANLDTHLDARGRGFFPGDTLRYYVRAFDNAPNPQMGRSREYALRLPSLEEVRDRSVADARGLIEDAERLAESARAQEAATKTLERTTPAESGTGDGEREADGRPALEFGETEAARRSLEEANRVLDEAREIQEALGELREALDRSGLRDSTVLERLREIESLYRRVLTPELESRVRELQEALRGLDAERIREAVKELAEGSVDFRQRVEQSVELLQRVALEQEFGTLETRARELVQEQERLLAATTDPDSMAPDVQGRAEELSSAADSLAERIDQLARELQSNREIRAGEQASEAGESAQRAGRADDRVARSMPARPSEALEAATQALNRMQEAAASLERSRQGMQTGWRQEVVEALERARAEAMDLARRQQEVNEGLPNGQDTEARDGLRSEEVALKRALEQLEGRLSESARSSLLVDPTLSNLARHIGESLDRVLDALSDGTRRRPLDPDVGEQVSEGLNELAYRLMQAAEGVASAQSGTGFQEALEQLAQMAEQQGQLNAQTDGLSLGALTQALGDRLQEMAGRQRDIGQRLQELDRSMGPRGQVLGRLDAMAREAEDIARDLEQGRVDERTIERQGRLFRRLLDAGRTLERDEFEKERRAERPADTEAFRPDELPPEMLRGPRYPHPGMLELRAFPPAFRQLILQYFDLLNRRVDEATDDT